MQLQAEVLTQELIRRPVEVRAVIDQSPQMFDLSLHVLLVVMARTSLGGHRRSVYVYYIVSRSPAAVQHERQALCRVGGRFAVCA
jgi:hypothetical protein